MSQFNLSTTISTGHTQNIFSIKFMPHSNDRTLVSAAGDAEVRIFDIEYSGQTITPSSASNIASSGRRRGFNNIYNGVRYLSDGDTNCRVYRSHGDRVKRIVTESSPHLFLTCSEDGEVRQWDLRQPSSAYPAPQRGRGWGSASVDDNVPPALISYKRYHLDLNTISCSPSQPHYIALGGAHLHCFLHDRRMVGRDKSHEKGDSLPSASNRSDHDEDLVGKATQCVRKFAPSGQRRMRRTDNGHITACKISDANPNEMIVSWSGEWIYSFDLLRSPDAREGAQEVTSQMERNSGKRKARVSVDRKRKREVEGSRTSQEGLARGSSRARTESIEVPDGEEEMAIRVQYENGQSEEIAIQPPRARSPLSEAQETVLPDSQRQSFRIAKGTVKLRKHLFALAAPKQASDKDPTGHATSFTSVLGFAASLLPEMDGIMRAWRYPVNPLRIEVEFQKALRRNRGSARRFVQACGTLSRVCGGKLRTAGSTESPVLELFAQIVPAPSESRELDQRECFGYDFLKAILLWLDSGLGALVQGFIQPEEGSGTHLRFPIEKGQDNSEAIDDILIPYLLRLAGDKPIINVDASRFEVDESRITFASEKAAVLAFAQALKIPFEDLSRAVVTASSAEEGQSMGLPCHRARSENRNQVLGF